MFNKTLKEVLLALLLIIMIPISGCSNSSTACSYVKNCYFETSQGTTFSDVNIMISPYLSEFNGYAYQIDKALDKNVSPEEVFENLLSVQQKDVPHPDFTDFKNVSMLYGDLLLMPQRGKYEKLPFSLRIYFEISLCKSFKEDYIKNVLPEEDDFQKLMLYEEMLARMGGATFYKKDAYLVSAFKNDEYFKGNEIASKGIYILGAINFLVRREHTGAMMPLPFTTELIEKRSTQFLDFKNKILSGRTISPEQKIVFLNILSNAFLSRVRTDTLKDGARIEKLLKSTIGNNGVFSSQYHNGISSMRATYYAVLLYRLFIESNNPIVYPEEQALLRTLKEINRTTSGVLVYYDNVAFNPWDTYWALYISEKNHCKVSFNKNTIKKELFDYLNVPYKHSFEEIYYASMSLKILGYKDSNTLKNYISSVKAFSQTNISEIYFFTLLSKMLHYKVPQNIANNIRSAIYKELAFTDKNEIELLVKAYLSLRNIGIEDEQIKIKIQSRIKKQDYTYLKPLYYTYLFAQSTLDKRLIIRCRNELTSFETHYQGLYSMYPGKEPHLIATYYGYKIAGK